MIELAKNILTKMKAAGFDQCEVQLSNRAMTEMQIDAGQISLLRTTESDGVGLRGIREKKYATLTLNQIDDKSIENGIEKLTQSCLASPADEARELAPGTQPLSYEFGPLQPKLTQMHERIVEFASNVKNKFKDLKLEQSGLQHNFVRAITLNSKNLCVEEAQGFYSFGAMFSGKRETKTSGFNYSSANRSDLESALLDWGVMEVNMKSTQEEIDHSPFSGEFVGPVVLTPEAFYDFL